MKKPRLGNVWFCLICQEDVQSHQVEVEKNADYRIGRNMLFGGLAVSAIGAFTFPGLFFIGLIVTVLGVPVLLIGGLRRGVMQDYCPCCGRTDLIPCDSPRAMKLKDAEAAYQASLPRPMAIRPDYKVSPPGISSRRRTITA